MADQGNVSGFRLSDYNNILAGSVTTDNTNNEAVFGPGNGNHDLRLDVRSVDSYQMDSFSCELDMDNLNSSFWVTNNEIKVALFDSTSATIFGYWITGTAGSPANVVMKNGGDTTVAYSASTMRFLQCVYFPVGDNVQIRGSSDGTSWVDVTSLASRNASFDTTDVSLFQLRLENSANASSIGTLGVNHINTWEQTAAPSIVPMTFTANDATGSVPGSGGGSSDSLILADELLIEDAVNESLPTIVRKYA